MAEIRKYPVLRHLRSEPSMHVLRFKSGRLVKSGRGLAFFFRPMNTSVAEVPVDDRDIPILFHARSRDFQDLTVQGTITFRVAEPETLGQRFDFSIDLERGVPLRQPLDQITTLLTGLVQNLAGQHLAKSDLREVLTEGLASVQATVEKGLHDMASLAEVGLKIVSARLIDLKPTPELEKALQTPTREALQQDADRATFERRALAVERERAIQENELQNQIELAKREETLIQQRGQNERRRATEDAEAQRIQTEAQAARTRIQSEAGAESIRVTEVARVEAEHARMAIYKEMSGTVLAGLAARELATKLQSIQHLNITPDLLGPILTQFVDQARAPSA